MLAPSPLVATAAVSLQQISKSYDGRAVITDLSLDVAPGEFLAIVGPSGSGKTTTMRIIAGFEDPDTGRVAIAGEDVTDLPAERRDVNTVFQSYALFPHMNVRDNVAFGPRMRGLDRRARYRKADEMLQLVRLGDAGLRMPGELSGGMQQRVALARALANDPAVLLLDEPLGALDRKLREDMQRELRRVQAELGATFVYVTHDQEEAFGMADRLAVMRDGRFEQIGDPATIYDRPANAWVARFVGSANTIPARLAASGVLTSDLGILSSEVIAPDLKPGAAVLALVRPEATRLEPRAANSQAAPNRIPATLVDRVTVGPYLRFRAATDDGRIFEAVANRALLATRSFNPGDPVFIAFDAAALNVYADADDSAPQPTAFQERTSP
ncbi:MAG TPA: ABC transporter ATP-binding protein [Devosiaceae bacterium]|jgi:ABC-type Fe3+/spermidine/putrescine transport system ATPase subunit